MLVQDGQLRLAVRDDVAGVVADDVIELAPPVVHQRERRAAVTTVRLVGFADLLVVGNQLHPAANVLRDAAESSGHRDVLRDVRRIHLPRRFRIPPLGVEPSAADDLRRREVTLDRLPQPRHGLLFVAAHSPSGSGIASISAADSSRSRHSAAMYSAGMGPRILISPPGLTPSRWLRVIAASIVGAWVMTPPRNDGPPGRWRSGGGALSGSQNDSHHSGSLSSGGR